MINPFDRNFFTFLIQFTLILIGSFTVIYIVQKYGVQIESAVVSAMHVIKK